MTQGIRDTAIVLLFCHFYPITNLMSTIPPRGVKLCPPLLEYTKLSLIWLTYNQLTARHIP